MSPRAFKSWLVYAGYLTVILAGLVVANFRLATLKIAPLNLSDYNSYSCNTQFGDEGEVFRILTLTAMQARQLADRACSFGTAYGIGSVEISWQNRDFLKPHNIVEGDFDLFWNRLHLMQGMVPNLLDYYTQVLDTPRYSLYWLTLDATPLPDSLYFQDKVVGMLNLSESQSFFQQPSAWLRNHNIELQESQIRYYSSVVELLSAFANGDVDLISAIPTMTSDLDIGPVQRLLIKSDMESGTWFLKQSWTDSKLGCALLTTLRDTTPKLIQGEGFSDFKERLACGWD